MADSNNLFKVIHIGLSFFFLFTAFSTCQNIVSEAYDQNNYGALGFYSLAVLYVTFAIWSFVSVPLIEKWGSRICIKIGSLWYLIWVASGILPITVPQSPTVKVIIWIVMLFTGFINGFGASILWVGQGKYVTDCCNIKNNGLYFGLFFTLFSLGFIAGNLIAAFVIKLFSQEVFFIVMSVFAFIGWITILLLVEPIKQENTDANDHEQYKSLTASYNSNENGNKSDNQQPAQGSLKSTIKIFFTVKMMKINALIIASAFFVAYYGGLLVKMISNTIDGTDDEKLTKSLYCMIVFSWGEVIAGFSIGKIIDFTSRKFWVFLILIMIIITIVITTYTHSREQYDVFWFVSAFLWGLTDSICNTVISSICGSEFLSDDNKEGSIEPFAIFKFTQSFFICILMIFESFIKNPDQTILQRWYLIGMGSYSVIAWIFALTFPFKRVIKDSTTLK